jgi:hypothetical protein
MADQRRYGADTAYRQRHSECGHFSFSPGYPHIDRIGLGVGALQYAGLGYAVLPLVRGGKKPHRMLPWEYRIAHPAPLGGVYWATTQMRQIWDWWATDPAANIGVATGQRSRLVVIDLDVKGGADGPGELARLLESMRTRETVWDSHEAVAHRVTSEPWPGAVPAVQTPSGGWHLWLRTPAGVAVPERPGILPGVDVKGDGGLVVAPPSMRLMAGMDRPGEGRGPGEVPVPYTWAAGCPCTAPDAPPWLLPWLRSAPSSGSPGVSTRAGENADAPDVSSLKHTGIPRGERNATLYRLACSLYRKNGTGPEGSLAVMEALNDVWAAGDRTGMTPSELRTISESARRFVRQEQDKEAEQGKEALKWLKRTE